MSSEAPLCVECKRAATIAFEHWRLRDRYCAPCARRTTLLAIVSWTTGRSATRLLDARDDVVR